MWNY
jgi:hypothetical protein